MARQRQRPRRGLCAAVGLGLAGGMRAFIPPATIALRDRRPRSGVARLTIVVASAVELVADKLPSTPSRVDPAGLGARFASSGAVGWNCAGPLGGLVAGATALGSAFVSHGARSDIGKKTGLPDQAIAVVEDVLAVAIARLSTRRPLDARPAPARATAGSATAAKAAAGSATAAKSGSDAPAAGESAPGRPTSSKAVADKPTPFAKAARPAKGRKAAKAAKAAATEAARSADGK